MELSSVQNHHFRDVQCSMYVRVDGYVDTIHAYPCSVCTYMHMYCAHSNYWLSLSFFSEEGVSADIRSRCLGRDHRYDLFQSLSRNNAQISFG